MEDGTSSGDHILQMRSITKTFPGVKALADVSLAVTRGEIHAICGENGAGKSTLMKVLSGVYPTGSYEGEIVFDGSTVGFSGIRDSEAVGIVIIHQELALVPYLSSPRTSSWATSARDGAGSSTGTGANAEAGGCWRSVACDENPVTPGRPARRRKQQLVEIAKALAKDVSCSSSDEPTAALERHRLAHLLDCCASSARGITCIMISHKLNEITAIADQPTVIRDGPHRRDARHARPERHPGAGSSAAWSAATWSRTTPSASPTRRGGAADRGLVGLAPHPGPPGSSTARTSPCGPARWSASPG
jgi:putative multiple sugar transport system ATP-binding protein